MQKLHDVYYKTPWYNADMGSIRFNDRFNQSPIAKQRLRVVEFYLKYGKKPTLQAFDVKERTLYMWLSAYRNANHNPKALIPKSRRPKRMRKSKVSTNIVREIRRIRYLYGTLGKKKIKPLLDIYCRQNGLETIGETTIGDIIRKYRMISKVSKPKKENSNNTRVGIERIRYAPKPKNYGHLEIDTIERRFHGGSRKAYIFSGVDVKLKFYFAYTYSRKTSKNAKDFLMKLLSVYPFRNKIHTIQTDNGTEFFGVFGKTVKKLRIRHLRTYPHSPETNGCIERHNRSVQEEFVYSYEHLIEDGNMDMFNQEMMEYVTWFNNSRPHEALGNISPISYVMSNSPKVKDLNKQEIEYAFIKTKNPPLLGDFRYETIRTAKEKVKPSHSCLYVRNS